VKGSAPHRFISVFNAIIFDLYCANEPEKWLMDGRKVLVIWTTLLVFAALWVTPVFADCASDSADCTDGDTSDSGEVVDEGEYTDGDETGEDDGTLDDGEYTDGGEGEDGGTLDEGEYTDGDYEDGGEYTDGGEDGGTLDEGEYEDGGEYIDGGEAQDGGTLDEGEYTDSDYEYYEVIDPYVGGDDEEVLYATTDTTDDLGDGTDGVTTDTDTEMYGAATNTTTAGVRGQHHAASASAVRSGASMAHMRLNAADLAAPVALFCGVNSSIEVWDIGADGQGTLAFSLPIDQLLDGEMGLGLGNQLSLLDGGQAELLSLESAGAYAFNFDPLVCAGA
jgi:hypothetical protein